MPPTLVPDTNQLGLICLTASGAVITMVVCTTRTEAPCPLCQQPSRRPHSRYQRTLADLPWQGVAVIDTIMWPPRPGNSFKGTLAGELRAPTPTPAGYPSRPAEQPLPGNRPDVGGVH
jgi:hypothetical protein